MKIAMFGGSFDPVHNDHIKLCETMIDTCRLDKVVVFPAACSPFKSGTQTEDLHRLNMCKIAFENIDKVASSLCAYGVKQGDIVSVCPLNTPEFIYLLYAYYKQNMGTKRPGFMFGIFLIVVFGSRILIEFIKNHQVAFEDNMVLDMGQWLSIPFVIAGIWLVFFYKTKKS